MARAPAIIGTTAPGEPVVAKAFAKLVAVLLAEGGVEDAAKSGRKGFGSSGLMVNGKLFAFIGSKDQLVLKLPRDRVTALVADGAATFFDPGHGRLMKEWIALSIPPRQWPDLARQARDYVGGKAR